MKDPFRKMAEEYSDRIYTFAYYSLRSREEAEDVTQEVLVKLWRHAEEIDPGKLTAWVMKVARHTVIDAARRSRTKAAVIADGIDIETAEATSDSFRSSAANTLETTELRGVLTAALSDIEEPYRSIIVMREVQGMTYADIADCLEMPLNTIKVYLHRGRRRLRETLKGKV